MSKNRLITRAFLTFFLFGLGVFPSLESKTISEEEKNAIQTIKTIINQFIKISSNRKISLLEKKKRIKKLYYKNVALEKFS